MNINYLHPADQLVMIMDRIYKYGMTTTSGGNLSIMDENGDVWITPGGIDKGTLTRKDMICIKKDGSIEGIHKPSSEYPFHLKVYESRSDVKAVLHAHPPALVAFSIVRGMPDTKLLANSCMKCGKIEIAEYGLPGSGELGEKIAKKFKAGCDIAVLENHGVVVGDVNLFEAFKSFETLDFAARLEIQAINFGELKKLTDEQIDFAKENSSCKAEEFKMENYSSQEKAIRRDICEMSKRAYDQQLFNSTQGSFSVRMSDGSFIITPDNLDTKYLEPKDLVRVREGKREEGKIPCVSYKIHQEIYKMYPDVMSVSVASPTYTMAFAVTQEELDSRTIPESYILLRDVKKLPFEFYYTKPEEIAKQVNLDKPMVLVKNSCIVSVGSSLLNAFDRLEVAEYSAKAILATKQLGNIVKINDKQIDDLKVAFKLN